MTSNSLCNIYTPFELFYTFQFNDIARLKNQFISIGSFFKRL